MRGRITYALYNKMGVTDCVAADAAHYVDLAVGLGTDPGRRAAVAAAIRAASPVLFEDAAAVRELEGFFRAAVARARPGAG
jgi:predicted O-linked N-acetylglucosamine transferase (SPINDLY family)